MMCLSRAETRKLSGETEIIKKKKKEISQPKNTSEVKIHWLGLKEECNDKRKNKRTRRPVGRNHLTCRTPEKAGTRYRASGDCGTRAKGPRGVCGEGGRRRQNTLAETMSRLPHAGEDARLQIRAARSSPERDERDAGWTELGHADLTTGETERQAWPRLSRTRGPRATNAAAAGGPACAQRLLPFP